MSFEIPSPWKESGNMAQENQPWHQTVLCVLEPRLLFVHAVRVLRQLYIHVIWEKSTGEVISFGEKIFLSGNLEDTKQNINS